MAGNRKTTGEPRDEKKKKSGQPDRRCFSLITTNVLSLCSFFSFPERIKEADKETHHKHNQEPEFRQHERTMTKQAKDQPTQ